MKSLFACMLTVNTRFCNNTDVLTSIFVAWYYAMYENNFFLGGGVGVCNKFYYYEITKTNSYHTYSDVRYIHKLKTYPILHSIVELFLKFKAYKHHQ